MKKLFLTAAAMMTASALPAQQRTFNQTEDWLVGGSKLKLEQKADGALSGAGPMVLTTKDFIVIDPVRRYSLSGTFRKVSGENVPLYFGFQLYDKNGREFNLAQVNAVRGTDTELAEPLAKGGRVLKITDGSRWNNVAGKRIVWNTDPSFSDLPNFNVLGIEIESVKQEDRSWTVTLKTPVSAALPAGTKLRLHQPGGTLYYDVIRDLGADWKTIRGVSKGIDTKPGIRGSIFPVGTFKVKLLLILNLGKKEDAVTEIKDVMLSIE